MNLEHARRRAVVTGIGVIAPTGTGNETWWQAALAGDTGIEPISRFDASAYAVRCAGAVPDFEPGHWLDERLLQQTDRGTQMAMVATALALQDAGLDPEGWSPERVGIALAGAPGHEWGQRQLQTLWTKGPAFVDAYTAIAWFPGAAAGQISVQFGIRSTSQVTGTAETGGLEVLDDARWQIADGMDAVIAGGVESNLAPLALSALQTAGCLSPSDDPVAAYLPFDPAALGWVPAEGGAILVVEELEAARARNASQLYGEIVGYAATHQGRRQHLLEPVGTSLARSIELALERAEITPPEIDLIFADAVAVPHLDAAESAAIGEVFGERAHEVPVAAPKSFWGRAGAGTAPLDVAAALLSMRDDRIPPMARVRRSAAGTNLNLIAGEPLSTEVRTVLILARGSGGSSSALVVRRV